MTRTITVNGKRMYADADLRFVASSKVELDAKRRAALPAGARCKTSGCGRMRGYYLNECYEHAGPDPYGET